jgi:hypothetical protein
VLFDVRQDMLKEFADSAKSLTRNPLGVVGLFLVMVYGFACLVIGVGGASLESQERLPIVWFVVIFPILVLVAFYRLVTKHHKKLYAPSDFKDEKLFFQPLSEERRQERLEEEVKRVEAIEVQVVPTLDTSPPASRSLESIRSSYAEAEKLGFLAIEEELKSPVQKYVEVVGHHGRKEQFDGLLLTETSANIIEIKYFSRPTFKREFLEAALFRASAFLWNQLFDDSNKREDIVFWLIVVADFPRDGLPKFKEQFEKQVSSEFFTLNIRFFHIDDLRNKYGEQGGGGQPATRPELK